MAEDRILCFEVIAREREHTTGGGWTMHYVKDAKATTDVPKTLVDLVKQRRRWLNGSFFAMLHAIFGVSKIWCQSNHTNSRKLVITGQFVFFALTTLLNWILPANLYLTMYFVLSLSFPNSLIFEVVSELYAFLIITQFLIGIGNKTLRPKSIYHGSCVCFGLIMFGVFGLSMYQFYYIVTGNRPTKGLGGFGHSQFTCRTDTFERAFQKAREGGHFGYDGGFTMDGELFNEACGPEAYFNETAGHQAPGFERTIAARCHLGNLQVLVLGFFSLGAFFAAALLHGELWAICSCFVQYIFMLPSFVNILMIYSFCNTHDLSWGTKGLDSAHMHGASQEDANFQGGQERKEREAQKKKEAEKKKQKDEEEFAAYRSVMMMIWVGSNALFVAFCLKYLTGDCYLTYLAYVVAGFNSVRFVGCALFVILRIPCIHYRGRGRQQSEKQIAHGAPLLG